MLSVLLAALPGFDRLVLLGDLIELRHGPVREALTAAAPVLREIGAALGIEREVVIVPGNHDHYLAGAWVERRARDGEPPLLGLESAVDFQAPDPLATVADWLAPARVRAAYPGLWLRHDVYATHGHYCDRHTTVPMLERLGAAVMARVVHEDPSGPRRAEDYEAALTPIYAWIHAVAQTGGRRLREGSPGPSTSAWRTLTGADGTRGLRRRGLAIGFPALVAGLNRSGLGPLHPDLSGAQLRGAGLLAFGEVLSRLDVQAPHAIFGHTHRAGPLPTDDRTEWLSRTGTLMLNAGSWVREPEFLGDSPGRSPYRPGFCAVLANEGPPEVLNLLDGAGVKPPVQA
jgi:hypothetical protein